MVSRLPRPDADIPSMNNIHILEDGTSIGTNGMSCLFVSPVKKAVRKLLRELIPEKDCGSVTLPINFVKDILKALPPDKKYNGMTEHGSMEEAEHGDVYIHTTDGTNESRMHGRTYRRPFRLHIPFLKSIRKRNGARAIVNLTRLLILLQSIDAIIKTSDDEVPVFIEFTDKGSLIIRGLDPVTGQRVMGIMNQYDYDEQHWLEENKWERDLVPKKQRTKS